MDVVLIPAYEPEEALIHLVDELHTHGFHIVVVNDGSGEKYDPIFAAVSAKADIVTLEQNQGKGAALKAGMAHIRDNLPDCTHFITCDADGQHLPKDVLRVKEKLHAGSDFVLTVRERKGKIPLRSRIGNDMSRVVYTLLTNRYLSDNQSGLRGFHRNNLEWLIKVEKNKYDYEMNVLYYAAKMGKKITTVLIDAIYIENNASSHFHPIRDTIRIYKGLFSLARGTFISWGVAEIVLLVMGIVFGNLQPMRTVATAGALALAVRLILDKYIFFKNIRGYDYFNTAAYTIICYFVYGLMSWLLCYAWPAVPIFWNFNLVYFFCMPLRFFMHQLIHMAHVTVSAD